IAHRIGQRGAIVRGEQENFMLRDCSEAADDAYDRTTARLQDVQGKRFTLEDSFHAEALREYEDERIALSELSRFATMDATALDAEFGPTPCKTQCGTDRKSTRLNSS